MINSLLKQLADERLLKQTLKAEHAGASALDHVISSFKWPKAGEAFEKSFEGFTPGLPISGAEFKEQTLRLKKLQALSHLEGVSSIRNPSEMTF